MYFAFYNNAHRPRLFKAHEGFTFSKFTCPIDESIDLGNVMMNCWNLYVEFSNASSCIGGWKSKERARSLSTSKSSRYLRRRARRVGWSRKSGNAEEPRGSSPIRSRLRGAGFEKLGGRLRGFIFSGWLSAVTWRHEATTNGKLLPLRLRRLWRQLWPSAKG